MGRASFAEEASTPDTPSSGYVTLYFLASGSGIPVVKDDAGTVRTVALVDVDNAFTSDQTITDGAGGSNVLKAARTSGAVGFVALNVNNGDAQVALDTDTGTNQWALGLRAADDSFRIADSASIGANDRLVIDSSGDVGIGVASMSGKLHVDQSDAAGARPALYLDQADVSEEMIEFASTIGTGNAIEAIGAKTLTTTHVIKVTIPGGLTRYFPVGTIA